jgi:hypothetical protein
MTRDQATIVLLQYGWKNHSHKWHSFHKVIQNKKYYCFIGSVPELPSFEPYAVHIYQAKVGNGKNYYTTDELKTCLNELNKGTESTKDKPSLWLQ